ncbi:MAG: phosphopantetheine-binding protein [Desulforhopalus sp.]|nr:phosphopantetheine-binding protein [Desulforhopalus sp.]
MTITREHILEIFRALDINDAITDDMLFTDQGLDSIDLPRAAAAIERKFNVDMSDAKAEDLKTMNLLLSYLNNKTRG